MKAVVLFFCLFSLNSAWSFNSPFLPEWPGSSIPNSQIIDDEGLIIRGMEPRKHLSDLVTLEVDHVLIFKRETRNEVRRQKEQLLNLGFSANQIHEIPFRWKDFDSFQHACEQTIQGLKLLQMAKSKKEKIYFHCTVGEDRTGHLSGLYRLLTENSSLENVFQDELCERGYERGNPRKPRTVVDGIRSELSVLFFEMADLIREKQLTLNHKDLSVELCDREWNLSRKTPVCRPSSKIQN